jgi:hypothetical protein
MRQRARTPFGLPGRVVVVVVAVMARFGMRGG